VKTQASWCSSRWGQPPRAQRSRCWLAVVCAGCACEHALRVWCGCCVERERKYHPRCMARRIDAFARVSVLVHMDWLPSPYVCSRVHPHLGARDRVHTAARERQGAHRTLRSWSACDRACAACPRTPSVFTLCMSTNCMSTDCVSAACGAACVAPLLHTASTHGSQRRRARGSQRQRARALRAHRERGCSHILYRAQLLLRAGPARHSRVCHYCLLKPTATPPTRDARSAISTSLVTVTMLSERSAALQ